MNLVMWLSTATGLFALVAAAAVAYAIARSNYAKATIELQSQNIQALFDRQKIQDNQIKELQMRNAKLEGELESFKTIPLGQLAELQSKTYEILTEKTRTIMDIVETQKLILRAMKINYEERNNNENES